MAIAAADEDCKKDRSLKQMEEALKHIANSEVMNCAVQKNKDKFPPLGWRATLGTQVKNWVQDERREKEINSGFLNDQFDQFMDFSNIASPEEKSQLDINLKNVIQASRSYSLMKAATSKTDETKKMFREMLLKKTDDAKQIKKVDDEINDLKLTLEAENSDNPSGVKRRIQETESALKQTNKANQEFRKQLSEKYLKQLNSEILNAFRSEEKQKAMQDFAIAHACNSGVTFNLVPKEGMRTQVITPEADLTQLTNEFQKQINEEQEKSHSLVECSKPVKMHSNLKPVKDNFTLDISGQTFFKDNSSVLESNKLKAIHHKIDLELKKLERPGCTIFIKGVQISASANQFANSSEIGRYNFLKLSTDRANYLNDHIQAYFDSEKIQKKNVKVAKDLYTSIDPTGSNGDGTSGTCPYEARLEAGKFLIEPIKNIDKASFEKYKSGSVYIETESSGKNCSQEDSNLKQEPVNYLASKCFEAQISCKR